MREPVYMTPIVLFAFNRPHLLQQVLEALSRQQTAIDRLIVYIDAPRHERDEPKVQACMALVEAFNGCKVDLRCRDKNLGCRQNIQTGLDEVFQDYRQAVVLEDDTVPNPYFYGSMCRLLTMFQAQQDIASVSGYFNLPLNDYFECFPSEKQHLENLMTTLSGEAIFISTLFSCWGWATWADRWHEAASVLAMNQSLLFLPTPLKAIYGFIWRNKLNAVLGLVDSWATRFQLQTLYRQKKHVATRWDQIQNIGFGTSDAAHCQIESNPLLSERYCQSYDTSKFAAYEKDSPLCVEIETSLSNNHSLGLAAVQSKKVFSKLKILLKSGSFHIGRYSFTYVPKSSRTSEATEEASTLMPGPMVEDTNNDFK